MSLLSLVNDPWAIEESSFKQVQQVLFRHLVGEKLSHAQISEAIGHHKNRDDQAYQVIGNTAVIPFTGFLARKINLIDEISGSGGTSTQIAAAQLKEALANDDIESIVAYFNTPGGTVDSIEALAKFIFDARGKKPIIGFCDHMVMSAGYWLAAACDEIYISGETVSAGSIGIVGGHVDISKAEEKSGIKTTTIFSGKYKVVGSEHEPLSDGDRAIIQDRLDHLYSVFVDNVAEFRGVSVEKMLQSADGKIFMGQDAIDAGLVDGMKTFDELIGSMDQFGAFNISNDVEDERMAVKMTKETVLSEYPEIAKAFKKEGEAAALASVQQDTSAVEGKLNDLQASNKSLSEKVEALTQTGKEQEKTLAIIKEKNNKAVADHIMDSALSASSIPGSLHAKVKNQVGYAGFVKPDEGFVAGSESVKAFSAAFSAEVKDWESKLETPSGGLGLGHPKDDEFSANSDKEHGDLGRKLAEQSGIPLRAVK